jgi:hypothetical protein
VPFAGRSRSCKFSPVGNALARRGKPLVVLSPLFLVGCHAHADAPAPTPSGDTAESAMMLGGEARVHPIGELATAPDYTMSLESDKECPLDSPFAPKRGYVKVGLELSVEGTSAVEIPVNPFYASLYDSGGTVYTSTLAGCEPGLPSVRVTAGRKVRGFVSFEIPTTSHRLELRYAPLIIGRGAEELRFAVVR